MSAFVVSDRHLEALVGGALYFKLFVEGPSLCDFGLKESARLLRMLQDENHRSVEFRYRDEPRHLPSTLGPLDPIVLIKPVEKDPVRLLRLIDCYEYQACEHPGWPESEAFRWCRALRARLIRELPGYQDAPWSI